LKLRLITGVFYYHKNSGQFSAVADRVSGVFYFLGVTRKGSGCTLQSFVPQAPQKDFLFHPSRKQTLPLANNTNIQLFLS
jgi:hypothetical protein